MTSRRSAIFLAFAPLAIAGLMSPAAVAGNGRRVPFAPVPPGYSFMARRFGVPSDLLYAVALQESQRKFGQTALPYPWTLNIEGTPRRFDSYDSSVAELERCLRAGVLSVDCGLLQINWKYHHRLLGTVRQAMAPYLNIAAGARLLRSHYDTTASWYKAVARYHNADPTIGGNYAKSVFKILSRLPDGTAPGVRNG